MRTFFVFLILILTIISVSYTCGGQVTHYIPAVVGNNGAMVNVTIAMIDTQMDRGGVYVSIYPNTGLMTQESIIHASDYAYEISGEERKCDLIITFKPVQDTAFIDGPSAGTALAVMMYSVMTNKTMRNDTVITGTVDNNGNVGIVGGLYEKAKGAILVGADYFITPPQSLYEHLILKKLEKEHSIIVFEASTVNDVIGFMTENRSIEQNPLTSRKREIPALPEYDYQGQGIANFREVAGRMITLEQSLIETIQTRDNESLQIYEYFSNEIQRQEGILGQGYIFTAANEAFLNYIDISTINTLLSGDVDLPRKKGEIGKCLTSIVRPNITDTNFEWVVGSDLRQAWAYDRLQTTEVNDLLADEKFVRYNELVYAEAWCMVAKETIKSTPDDGNVINESAWKQLAQDMLENAEATGTMLPETASRLIIAQDSYDKGRYGAAIYDSAYVIAMENADRDISNRSVAIEVVQMIDENRTSLWGGIYQSHAAFLYHMNETNTAYKIFRLAQELDRATENMTQEIKTVEIPTKTEDNFDNSYYYGIIVIISIFLFILFIILYTLKGKIYGGHGNRHNKTNRTKKKKG
ncbi:hypothetical protein KKF81_02350 [Candidatus Micrarchaeota archaeon]|nr:hypothetical protein [Candidatus Micrarchaeota archaeon]MBU1165761.1 hypothetical protein [Candidatus Micrarchaeota archaeon]MBU1886495.1 hypothetical protein [Candidatus Micrarchaeota archaeon]